MEDNDEKNHSKLLKSLSSLSTKKRSKTAERTEPSALISEFHLSAGDGKVQVHELLKSLTASSNNALSKKQLRAAAHRTRVLHIPLPRLQSEKLKRTTTYNKVSKDIGRWDSVVDKNRLADCIEFPLNQPNFRLQPTSTYVKRFQIKTPLEIEISRLLKGCDDVVKQEQILSPAEERALKAMSLEEARQRLRELQKMRALLTYQESKARRQNKIKSKSYHRILKKDRLRKQLVEFEELKKTNPELALEKLQDLDKRRIEERLTLKHKNTGKWAKQNILRSKYDKTSRDALSDQLELNRQLTQKMKTLSSEDETESEAEVELEKTLSTALPAHYNAWLINPAVELPENQSSVKSSNQCQVEVSPAVVKLKARRKIVKLKQKSAFPNTDSKNVSTITEEVELEIEEPEILCESVDPLMTIDIQETVFDPQIISSEQIGNREEKDKSGGKKSRPVNIQVDPTKFIGARPKKLLSSVPVLMDYGDEDLDDTTGTLLTMREAFAEDDVLEEFKTMKEDTIESSKPKDLDLCLPGWGDWGGSGISPSSKRKKRR